MPIDRKCVYWMKKCLPKGVYWKVTTLHIRYTKRCLLTKNVSIEWKCACWPKMCLLKGHNSSYEIYQKVSINWKGVYWSKRYLLNENMPIDQKDANWKMKSHNCSVFLNVYVALIYVAIWRNKERLTKN